MTGKELYDLYVQANNKQDCGVDDWDRLDDNDHEMWEYMAARLVFADAL